MAVLETSKKVAEKATGLARPSRDQIEALVRVRKANALQFKDDGVIPNNSSDARTVQLKASDVANLPASTGHQCLAASADFLVVGAYPPSGTYDECTKSEEHARALKTISKVSRPRKNPVYGSKGPLLSAWKPLR
jgi:hypothetical protein